MPHSEPPPSLLHEHMGGEYVASRVSGPSGSAGLLRHEGRGVDIPQALAEESVEKPDAAAQAVQAACATCIQVRNVTGETAVTLVQASLHKGEALEVIGILLG
jgi:hypothetical protein